MRITPIEESKTRKREGERKEEGSWRRMHQSRILFHSQSHADTTVEDTEKQTSHVTGRNT